MKRDSSLVAIAQNDRGRVQTNVVLCVILRKRNARRIWVEKGMLEREEKRNAGKPLGC